MTILKSIGAVCAGIIVGAVLSLFTDMILKNLEIIPRDNLWVGTPVILFVLFYRTIYNILGSYIVARLAPRRPMLHALIVGAIGTIVSIIGALATATMNLGPAWYAWTLAALSLPSAWLGGKIYLLRK
jgi:hypothetical protein